MSHKVTLSLEPRLQKELDKMKKQGIIGKPTAPNEWLNNLIKQKKVMAGSASV